MCLRACILHLPATTTTAMATGSLPAAAYAARWALAPRMTDQQGNKPTTLPGALLPWDTTLYSTVGLVFSFFNIFFFVD